MTVTLELRAARLTDIAAELATPTLLLEGLVGVDRLHPETIEEWGRLQQLVAGSIADQRRVTTEPEVSRYVAAVMRHMSYWWDELGHRQVDGPSFRSNLTDEVGIHLGLELTAALVRRPFVGLVADAHPYAGWVTHEELAATVAALPKPAPGQRESHTSELRSILTSILAAAERGLDLVTIYDAAETVDPLQGLPPS